MSDAEPPQNDSQSNQTGQMKFVSAIIEYLKVGLANITTLKVSGLASLLKGLSVTGDVTVSGDITSAGTIQASAFVGPFTLPGWLPYPAGTYVFPSGNQTVAAGVMPVGATVTAPTFGTGTTKKAWYKDNGNNTIDIMCTIHQTSTTGAAAGSVTYLLAPPLGYEFDTTMIEVASNDFNGAELGHFSITGNSGGSPLIMQGKATPTTSKLFRLGMALYGASNTGNWNSTYFPPTALAEIVVSFLLSNVPVL